MVKSKCEKCGYAFDAATELEDGTKVKPDDVSICFKCGALGIFNSDLSVRPATNDEVRDIMHSDIGPMIELAQKKIRTKYGSQK